MKQEMFDGLLNASAQKRYDHFLSVASDQEAVWLVDCGEDNLLSPEIEGIPHLLVWSEKEFAEHYLESILYDVSHEIVAVEIHEFMELLLKNQISLMVFPTEKDAWVVKSGDLYENLLFELSRYE